MKRRIAENDPPSLAELAHNKEFWAVRNICRRRVFESDAEFIQPYKGKDVVQWAVHHGQNVLVDELHYFEVKLTVPYVSILYTQVSFLVWKFV
jgi:hypothetical protein